MGVKRIVDTSFWTDGKVDEFSPEDKFFMLYLLTNPFSRQLGIYEISVKQAAFHMGYSVEAVNVLLDRFETKYNMIRFSRETNEVAIINFLRHSVMKGGKPVEDCIKQDMQKVKDKSLIDFVFRRLRQRDDLNVTVKKVVADYFLANENDNDKDNDNDKHNENDNDNDRTGHESYHESSPESYHESSHAPTTGENDVVVLGKYNNVRLTLKEFETFKSHHQDWNNRIERLSYYMISSGKSYQNHFVTLEQWAKEDQAKAKAKQKAGSFDTDAFFNAALEKSYKEPPKTAADDDSIRERGEELKQKLIGGDTA